ncbi:MAG: hypothetical protein ACXWC5_25745, partial [Burkholderiales bacterium]
SAVRPRAIPSTRSQVPPSLFVIPDADEEKRYPSRSRFLIGPKGHRMAKDLIARQLRALLAA